MFEQNQNISILLQGLRNLTDEELLELDAAVTPRTAKLLSKAFGPEIEQILTPLTENDIDPTDIRAGEAGFANADTNAGDDEASEILAAEEALRRLMRDPRYYRDRDPMVVNMVSEGFKRLYPEGARV